MVECLSLEIERSIVRASLEAVCCVLKHGTLPSDTAYSFRGQYLFKPRPGETPKDHKFYRSLYPQIIQDIEVS